MTSKAQQKEVEEVPTITKVTLDAAKKVLTQSINFFEVIEATTDEYSIVTKTYTGELKQYRALSGGEKIQIFDGEKEIE